VSGISRKKTKNPPLQPQDTEILADYVTAIAWSPEGRILAASSGAGDIILWRSSAHFQTLKFPTQSSVDCLSFSRDGQFLAAGGQDGKLQIWHLPSGDLRTTLENAPAWIDKLAWSPHRNQIAFSIGKSVCVWDANTEKVVTTLNFETSSVLDLAWHPTNKHLAIAGYQGIKIWDSRNWQNNPHILKIPSASQVIAWSSDGKYLASGNLDRTITVTKWGNPFPWLMQGCPGKIRALAWSNRPTVLGAPLLATASAESTVVWEKQVNDSDGWQSLVLEGHLDSVSAIDFYPETLLLASAAEDGRICLWQDAEQLRQTIKASKEGISCLVWQPLGQFLASGGFNGELRVWTF
jgi:WD40 repeat protein